MRILYLSQYYPPEMGAPAARVSEFARQWRRLGHAVTVLTAFPQHPLGIKQPGDCGKLTRRERIDDIDVVRTYIFATPNAGVCRRMISYGTFMLSSALIGSWRVRRPDVVIATSPQLLCGLSGYVLAKLFRVPFVFEVRDLWPESIMAVGAMRENFIVRRLKSVARFLYRHSRRIVTVGEGYREGIIRRYNIDPDKIDVIHNGVDPTMFTPGPKDNEIRREFGWGDRFVVLYLGTHGMAHGLNAVLDAAALLRDRDHYRFVFVGEGAEKQRLKQRARVESLTNVQFIDQQPKPRVLKFYDACDVGLVSLRNTPLFQEVLPSKIFEYFGMGKPILINVEGQASRLVTRAGAGWAIPPENPQALADAVVRISQDPDRIVEMGQRGRKRVLEEFNRAILAERYLSTLERVIARD